MKVYIDEKERYKDMKSTGFSFTLVGILGLAAIALVWLGIIPFNVTGSTKYLMTFVMGALFLIFLIVGIKSYLSLKKIEGNIDSQINTQEEIVNWFIENKACLDELVYDEESTEEEKYLQKYDFVLAKVTKKYTDLSEETADHLVETIITKIDDENPTE